MSKVRIFYKKDAADPGHMMKVENTLEAFQELVGGYIETFTFSQDTTLVINEEGRLLGLPVNMDFFGHRFFGPMIFVGYNDDGEFVDLPVETEEEMRRAIG